MKKKEKLSNDELSSLKAGIAFVSGTKPDNEMASACWFGCKYGCRPGCKSSCKTGLKDGAIS